MKKCPNCGKLLDDELHFCPALNADPSRVQVPQAPAPSKLRIHIPSLWWPAGWIQRGPYFVWSFLHWFAFFVCVDQSVAHPLLLLPGFAMFRGIYCLNVKRLRTRRWPMWLRWLTFVPFVNLLLTGALFVTEDDIIHAAVHEIDEDLR